MEAIRIFFRLIYFILTSDIYTLFSEALSTEMTNQADIKKGSFRLTKEQLFMEHYKKSNFVKSNYSIPDIIYVLVGKQQ